MTFRPRILAVHQDEQYLDALTDALSELDFDVIQLEEATRVVPVARELEPHLIVLGQTLSILTGSEVLKSLRAFSETEDIPTVLTLATDTESELLRALRAGATDAIPMPFQGTHVARLQSLIEEARSRDPNAPAVPRNTVLAALFRVFRAERRHGTLMVNEGTPFEGHAAFADGLLVSGGYGPLTGEDALREMLELEDGVWRFAHGKLRASTSAREMTAVSAPAPRSESSYRPRVLVVDDEPALRRLFDLQLNKSGFDTAVAEDGERGFEAALHTPFDVILADLHMPKLDGWGLLQRLKADQRTREVPVVFISAHHDFLEALKLARAGAADYLAKTGRADEVVPRLNRLLEPRMRFWVGLGEPGELRVQVHQLGIQWILRTLAQSRATGELELRDEWGVYGLVVEDGIPVSANAKVGRRELGGLAAVGTMLVTHGAEGRFITQAVQKGPQLAVSMAQLLRASGEMLNRIDSQSLEDKLAQGMRMEVDEVLYALLHRVGRDPIISLARAVAEGVLPLSGLGPSLSLTSTQVARGLTELIGRGVLRFADQRTPLVR